MNHALERLAGELNLSAPGAERLRLQFGSACALRVRHLLEEPEVEGCLLGIGSYLAGETSRAGLQQLKEKAARLANQHQGSKSIDGSGHAAVSASYAVARALEGKALEAASYAAYAMVYAQGGSAAVAEPEAFDSEFRWQVETLEALAKAASSPDSAA